MQMELRLKSGLGVAGLAPWGAVSADSTPLLAAEPMGEIIHQIPDANRTGFTIGRGNARPDHTSFVEMIGNKARIAYMFNIQPFVVGGAVNGLVLEPSCMDWIAYVAAGGNAQQRNLNANQKPDLYELAPPPAALQSREVRVKSKQ